MLKFSINEFLEELACAWRNLLTVRINHGVATVNDLCGKSRCDTPLEEIVWNESNTLRC